MHYQNNRLQQLRGFYYAARANSITKAAESLHMTQPAASIQLKNFQDQFEIPLTGEQVTGRDAIAEQFKALFEITEALHIRSRPSFSVDVPIRGI